MFDQQQLSKRILVVDDDDDIVECIATFLESAGHQVARAYDGEDALQKASEHHPDLVLLDINMPLQDGWLVCSKLKLAKSAPKIVFMTGETRSDLEHFANFVHADSVLRKPFSIKAIERVVNEFAQTARVSA